jgi:DNA-binding NarL/FixJ family response regulator
MPTTIVALEKDLFFSVKIRDTLRHHEIDVQNTRTLAAFEQALAVTGEKKPALVIVHIAVTGLDWIAAIRTARTAGYPVLAFGSHMDIAARKEALQAGAQRVVANSKFSRDLPELVRSMIANPPTEPIDDGDDE